MPGRSRLTAFATIVAAASDLLVIQRVCLEPPAREVELAPAPSFLMPVAVVLAGWAFPGAGTTVLGWLQGTSPGWLALAAIAILAALGTASSLLAARFYLHRDL